MEVRRKDKLACTLSGIDAQVTSYGDAVVPISMKIIGTLNIIDIQFTIHFKASKGIAVFYQKCTIERNKACGRNASHCIYNRDGRSL